MSQRWRLAVSFWKESMKRFSVLLQEEKVKSLSVITNVIPFLHFLLLFRVLRAADLL